MCTFFTHLRCKKSKAVIFLKVKYLVTDEGKDVWCWKLTVSSMVESLSLEWKSNSKFGLLFYLDPC